MECRSVHGSGRLPVETKTKKKAARADKMRFFDLQGRAMATAGVPKFYRDILAYWHGRQPLEDGSSMVQLDPSNPSGQEFLPASSENPICLRCNLFSNGCRTPFMAYAGPKNPLITVVYEGAYRQEDLAGMPAGQPEDVRISEGYTARLRRMIVDLEPETGVPESEIRWVPVTRCADRSATANMKVKANWCRHYIVEELRRNPPQMVMAVGTVALGALCHKSNAGDWQGYQLTYRGWPDDWLTNVKYVEPRPHPSQPDQEVTGHYLFGSVPTTRIPLMAVQSPRLVMREQNPYVTRRWRETIKTALLAAKNGIKPKSYTRPWYRFVNDPEQVAAGLQEIIDNPGTLVCYDTETTGLKPLARRAAIVSMMFRWTDQATGEPRSLGFPWDFRSKYYDNRVVDHIPKLAPLVLEALACSRLVAHNANFDFQYTLFNVHQPLFEESFVRMASSNKDTILELRRNSREFNLAWDNHLCRLAEAFEWDTWHMAYTLRQERGSLGLEMLAYKYAPDIAGYEEDMTLLIEQRAWQLHPGSKSDVDEDTEQPVVEPESGGDKDQAEESGDSEVKTEANPHYLNIDEKYYPSHVVPYVMGDVEACYLAREELEKRLESSVVRKIPVADPRRPGRFRLFRTPSRSFVYEKIMSPAARTLMCVMARGMYVDQDKLTEFEVTYPKRVVELREAVKKIHPAVQDWCDKELAQDPNWELDLECKSHLKYILYGIMGLPVKRLTKAGRKLFGESEADWRPQLESGGMSYENMMEYAALDKFTLSSLVAEHAEIRPLQDYRREFKLYSTYVRPLRNYFSDEVDKRKRVKDAHLCWDSCIHSTFLLTGTRTGRLSSKDPNLQQLPNRGTVKQLFISRFGERGAMYQADLSQIELRLMAAICGDPIMCKAYTDNMDLHTLTASRIYSTDYDHFSKGHFEWLEQHGRSQEKKELELKRRVAKCVDPCTLISSNGRIMRIGDLHPGRDDDRFYAVGEHHDIQVPSGVTQPLRQFYSSGIRQRVLVVGRYGLLACSRNHRLMLDDGRLVFAEDLKPGDVLKPVDSLRGGRDSRVQVPITMFESKSSAYTVNIDSDYAYVLGLFYGDGSVNKNSVRISTGGKPEYFDWQDTVAAALAQVGFTPTIRRTTWLGTKFTDKLGPVTGSSGEVYFGSHKVINVLKDLGAVNGEGKRSLRIPDWLLNADVQLCYSFLAGLLDTDGYVGKRGEVRLCTKSWEFAQDLLVMLHGLGIAASVHADYNKTYRRHYYILNLPKCSSFVLRKFMRNKSKVDRMRLTRPEQKLSFANVVKSVLPLEDGPLVEIALDAPHIYVPNGIACHQTANFLTGYGGGALGLQTILANNEVYKSLEECEDIIAAFFEAYPALRDFLSYYKRFVADNRVAVSMFGRVRILEEASSNDKQLASKALRAGCNHVIQSTASDMMLVALTSIEKLMRAEGLESILVSTVHDSLLIDAVRKELPVVHEIVHSVLNNYREVLTGVFGDDYDLSWLTVPIAGDCEVGLSYYDTVKIPNGAIDWNKLLAE